MMRTSLGLALSLVFSSPGTRIEWTPARLFTSSSTEGLWYKVDQPDEVYEGANHFSYTESFASPFWVIYNHTRPTDGTLNPLGTAPAVKMVPNNGTTWAILYTNNAVQTIKPNGPRTLSIYMKAGGMDFAFLAIEAVGWEVDVGACFNLITGAVTNISPEIESAVAEDVGNGWWRCSVSIANTSTDWAIGQAHGMSLYPRRTAGVPAAVPGNAVDGIYVWGVQFEKGLAATPYDPVPAAWETKYKETSSHRISSFQESTGLNPVIAGDQGYGLILDKRYGLQRGPEQVANGTFDTDVSGWTDPMGLGGTFTAVGGKGVLSQPDNGYRRRSHEVTCVVGKHYEITVEVSDTSIPTAILFDPTGNGAILASRTGSGPLRVITTATSTSMYVTLVLNGIEGSASFDNISVKEIPGYHASQPDSTMRPIAPAAGFQWMSDHVDDNIFIDANMFDLPYMPAFVNTPFGHYKTFIQGTAGIPLNGATEMVAKASFTAQEEAELANYFGTPRVFLVLRNNSTAIHGFNELKASQPINVTFVGANGVTVTKSYQGPMGAPDLSVDGLTAPLTIVFPASMIADPTLEDFLFAYNEQAGSTADISALTGLKRYSQFNTQMVTPIPKPHPAAPLTYWVTYNNAARANGFFGEMPNFDNYSGLTQLHIFGGADRSKSYIYGVMPTLASQSLVTNGLQILQTKLAGELPPLANTGASLRWYNVRSNDPLNGVVPNLSHLTGLTLYSIRNQALTGNIPSLITHAALPSFRCDSNQFTGYSGGGVTANLGSFEAQDNLLTAAAVNAILADFVAANRTTGTRILNLGGTGNAAPTGQGLIDKQTLIDRGWTVTTN